MIPRVVTVTVAEADDVRRVGVGGAEVARDVGADVPPEGVGRCPDLPVHAVMTVAGNAASTASRRRRVMPVSGPDRRSGSDRWLVTLRA